MVLSAVEISTDRVEDRLGFEINDRDLVRTPRPLNRHELRYRWRSGNGGASRPSQLGRSWRHRLTVSGPNRTSLVVPLQVDESKSPDFWLQTPRELPGFELRLFIDNATKQANLWTSVTYAGLPVEQALSYARFLFALYSPRGEFTFTLLEPKWQKFDVAKLPLYEDEETKAKLEVTLRFLEDLVTVGEATGTELVYPHQLDAEDVSNARRVAEIVRTGWTTERVDDLRLTPTREGLRNVPLEEDGAIVTIAVDSERASVILVGTEIDLGPSVHWIEQARLDTPLSQINDWLASDLGNEAQIEVHFVPVNGSPMHVFFREWPKPSLEHVRRELEAFEERYGMESRKFASAWRKGKENVQHIEDGSIWMSLIGARKELERG